MGIFQKWLEFKETKTFSYIPDKNLSELNKLRREINALKIRLRDLPSNRGEFYELLIQLKFLIEKFRTCVQDAHSQYDDVA
jgi:hypothetical protein